MLARELTLILHLLMLLQTLNILTRAGVVVWGFFFLNKTFHEPSGFDLVLCLMPLGALKYLKKRQRRAKRLIYPAMLAN